MNKYNVALMISHPAHYQVPLFRKLINNKRINLTVYYCNDLWVSDQKESEFGVSLPGNESLLEGYNYKFLRNYSLNPDHSQFWGLINPGIISELIKNDFDAVVTHGYFFVSYWLTYIGAWMTRTPVLFRGEVVLRPDQAWWKKTIKFLITKILSIGTDAFLSLGEVGRKFYTSHGISKDRIFDTPYAVNNNFFIEQYEKYYPNKSELKAKLGIEPNSPVALFVGKLVERKRPMDLLKAFQRLQKEGLTPAPYLIFVGEGRSRPSLENYVKDNNMNNVIFTGFQPQTELPKFYSMADVFVLPSEHEVSPLVVNEAMCFKLPVVLSEVIPSSIDFVENGMNGFTFKLGDISELAGYLKILFSNKGKREEFGNRSLEIVSEYNYEKDIDGILKALEYTSK